MNISIMIANFNKETMFLQPWRYAYNVAKGLVSLGCCVTLFTNCQSKISSIQDSVEEITVKMLPNHNLRFLDRKSLEVIKQKKPDVMYWFGNSLSGVYLRRLRRLQIPIVLHVSAAHYSLSDLKSLSLREFLSHWLNVVASMPPSSLFVRLLNYDVITIIVSSKYVKDSLCNFGVLEEKIKVAPLAYNIKDLATDESETISSARQDIGLEKENFIVTYLGSPDTVRGTDTLVHAAVILKSNLRNFNVIILSRRNVNEENKDEELLFRLTKKFELANIMKIVPGVLSSKDIENYLKASDVIALPFKIALSEPPLAVLEAMTVGKPVVTTKTCGLPELVCSDRGLLVKPGDPEDLARALHYLSRNPQVADSLGRRARKYVESLTNWNELVRWTAEVLYQAVQEESGRSQS